MEDDILTIEEVSRYLRVSDRTIYDWAQRGEIPAGKIGTIWRFKKSEIEKWVNMRLGVHSAPKEMNAVVAKNILSPNRVIFIEHSSKRDAIVELAENLSDAPQVKNRKELVDEILKREDLMSTAIGKGVAIPHVRLSSVTDLVVSVGICKKELLDFQTIDDIPVRILIMIAAAFDQHSYYLRALSFFSAKLRDPEFRDALISQPNAISAYSLLTKE